MIDTDLSGRRSGLSHEMTCSCSAPGRLNAWRRETFLSRFCRERAFQWVGARSRDAERVGGGGRGIRSNQTRSHQRLAPVFNCSNHEKPSKPEYQVPEVQQSWCRSYGESFHKTWRPQRVRASNVKVGGRFAGVIVEIRSRRQKNVVHKMNSKTATISETLIVECRLPHHVLLTTVRPSRASMPCPSTR